MLLRRCRCVCCAYEEVLSSHEEYFDSLKTKYYADNSQRMLNAIGPGSILPIHQHQTSSKTIVCIRGHFEELLYDYAGNLVEAVDMVPGGNVLNIPIGQWHTVKSLERGTVLLEAKDGGRYSICVG